MQDEYESSSKALNYYWGMSAGVVDVSFSETLTNGTRHLADFLKESIVREVCSPFLTPICIQGGGTIGEGQGTLSQEQIAGMDYLVENVVGSIPAYTELTPLAQATVDTSGVTAATEKAGKEA